MTVLRRGYVPVEPDTTGFDDKLKEQIARKDPGGKAGKQIGGQLNRALKRLDLAPIDVKADPRQAFAKIEETEAKLKRLALESPTVEVKIQTERALSQLTRFKKQLGDMGGGDSGSDVAEKFSASFIGRLGPLLAKAPVSAPMAVAALAVAPLIAAGISGAVIGGAGAGGVIGGLILVKDDPRVEAAGKALGEKLLGTLKRDAAPFVEPVLAAAAKVESRFDAMNGRIQKIFSKSSGFLDPLVDGALHGIDEILRGVESLISKGKPVIDAFGDSFAILGKATGDALSVISGDSKDAADAIIFLAHVIGGAIQATGYLVRGFTELYGVISYIPSKLTELSYWGGRLVGIFQATDIQAKSVAGSVAAVTAAVLHNADAAVAAARANGLFVATAADLKTQQQVVTDAQDNLNRSIAAMAPAGTRATQVAQGLQKAIQSLTGAQMSAIDANEAYEASWDNLSESIKTNGRSLNIHTAAGRSNRDALESVASATRDAYIADIAAGVSLATATKKHNDRIVALKEEAKRNHLNKTETDKLVTTYGSIPKGKQTKLVVAGVDQVVQALKDLYVFQRSLADGIPIASEIAKLKGEKGPAKRYGGYAKGGAYEGRLPGAASSVDNLTGIGRDGKMFGLAGGEFIVNARQTAKHRAALEDLNAGRNGYAAGGYYPVEQRDFRFRTSAGNTRVPSKSEVESKVILAVPTGGRTSDWIVRAARQIVPGITVLSKDRPGAVTLTGHTSYHALGRAVDFTANRHLAEVWNQRYLARTKELISPWQDLNIQNGRRHAYSPLVYNQHNFEGGNAHDHIAMAGGGVIGEPVLGVGLRSGSSYSFGERGPETVTPGVGGNTFNITMHVPVGAHPAEVGRQTVLAIQEYERGNGNRWRKDD